MLGLGDPGSSIYFSVTLLHCHPWQYGYPRPLLELKDATFNTLFPIKTMISHHEPWAQGEKMSFYFSAIFYFSITLLRRHPCQHRYLRPQSEVKYATFNTLLPTSTTCIHRECRVSKNVLPSFHDHFSVGWFLFFFNYTVLYPSTPMCMSQGPDWIILMPTT